MTDKNGVELKIGDYIMYAVEHSNPEERIGKITHIYTEKILQYPVNF